MSVDGTTRGATRVFELLLTGSNGHYTATPVTASGPGQGVAFTLPTELAPAQVSAGLDRAFRSARPVPLGAAQPPTPEEFGAIAGGDRLRSNDAGERALRA
jgi:hypothetical protein